MIQNNINIRHLFVLLIIFISHQSTAQLSSIKGKVTGVSIEPLPYVTIGVLDQINNAVTNSAGEYEMKLSPGRYTLVFSCIGYETYKQEVILKSEDKILNVILKENRLLLNEIDISAKYTDPAKRIVQQVIKHKAKYIQTPYETNLYIKAVESENKIKKDSLKKNEKPIDSLRIAKNKKKSYKDSLKQSKKISHLDSLTLEKRHKIFQKDSLKSLEKEFVYDKLNLAEVVIKKNFDYPNKLKEERIGFDIRGNISGLFYLSTTEGEFNFYQNAVYCLSLSETPFLSPLSTTGLLMYQFKTLKVYEENGQRIFRIKIEPNLFSNSLVSGEMEIIDSLFCLRSFKFIFPKHQLSEYTSFQMESSFVPYNDTMYRIDKTIFDYKTGSAKNGSKGRTTLYYENFKYQKGFPKKYFTSEVSNTPKEALEKDSVFWQQIRKEPLTDEELRFIRIEDSIKVAHESKTYLDSIDKQENRITLSKIVLFGQTRYNRSKELRYYFSPLWLSYQPVGVGGARIRYEVDVEKTFRNKKTLYLSTNLNYGILNRDLNGLISVGNLYNPFKQAYWRLEFGRFYDLVNASNTWTAAFRTANYYLNEHISVYHSTELFNGFYWDLKLEYSTRKSISNFKNDSLTNLFLDNGKTSPVNFDLYDAFYMTNSLSYTPKQKYIREPFEKKVLGSKFPTFTVLYRNGIPGFLNSTVNFDYLEYSISKDIDFRFLGISKIRVYSGKFYNKSSVKIIDYKYQPRVGFPFFANPLSSFQSLEESYITLDRFYAAHYFHRFNGALINKIPYLKKLKMTESAGGGVLKSAENNLIYFEAFAGIEKSIRIFRETFRLGFYFVSGKTNNYQYNTGFRLSIDQYNRLTNKWSY